MIPRTLAPLAAAAALLAPAGAQAQAACQDQPHCAETSRFVATVTDFRESTSGYDRVVSVTLRIRNTSPRPLTLGYVQNSGLVTDDQGNRYQARDASLRGLGVVSGNTFDAKFTLPPGEFGDGRLEFAFRPGNAILGTRYVLELAVREIDPLQGNQWRLGREHALQYRGFGAPEPVAAAAPAPAPAAPAPEPTNPCEGRDRCYAAGPFMAEVTRVDESKASYYQILTISVRFRNLGGSPLVLAYASGTALAVDDQGNRYGPAASNHVRGIGLTSRGRADPSFSLRPGESREATFQMAFRPGRAVIGTVYAFDFAVEELELLPRSQIRTVREYTLGYRDLTASGPGAGAAARGVLDALRGRRKP
jgi:hypothetical protein